MKERRGCGGAASRVSLGAAALVLAGCHGSDLGLAAEQSLRWTWKVDEAAALSALLYAGSTHGHTPEEMVQLAIPAVTGTLTPGCLAAPKVEGARVTYVFQACKGLEGSHGVRDLQGTVVAEYSINDLSGDTLGLSLSTQGLTLNGTQGELSLAAGNVFPASSWATAPDKELAFHLADRSPPASASEDRDALLTFSGDHAVPEGCEAGTKSPPRIGAATGLARVDDGAAWTISAAGYARCGERCPLAGTVRAQREIAIEVTLDGSAAAKATDLGSGETLTVPLDCTP